MPTTRWQIDRRRGIGAGRVGFGDCPALYVNTNLVFTWRRQFSRPAQTTDAGFLPVVVQPEAPPGAPPSQVADTIEIELPRGYRLRVSGTTKASALRLVLDVLERR